MLHEILYLLLGKPGDLFETRDASIAVKDDIPFFHPHEVVVINQLGKIGFSYMKLESFVEDNSACSSLYLSAFINGLDKYLYKY